MIHVMLPSQYLRRAGARFAEPHARLMAAVLQTVLDDCRGTAYRRARGYSAPDGRRDAEGATAYVASTDRRWPFSFENLCEALGLDAGSLRNELGIGPEIVPPAGISGARAGRRVRSRTASSPASAPSRCAWAAGRAVPGTASDRAGS
jgi:hypothetical protein